MTMGTLLAFWSWPRSRGTAPAIATVFSHFGTCVFFHVKQSDERTNRQTNKHDCSVSFLLCRGSIPRLLSLSPALSRTEGAESKLKFGFQQNQELISDFKRCHYGFDGVRCGRTTTVLRSRMRSDNACNNEQRRQHLRALISLCPGQMTRISMA